MALQIPMELLPVTVISSVALLFVLAVVITLCSCFNRRTDSSRLDDEEALRSLRDHERIKEGEEERSKISYNQAARS